MMTVIMLITAEIAHCPPGTLLYPLFGLEKLYESVANVATCFFNYERKYFLYSSWKSTLNSSGDNSLNNILLAKQVEDYNRHDG